ncbi:hypothetical protein NDS46_28560 [Paenibacillus thiaminolyticus]|uniref:hypothetical protein n=1 Tax=Paenibacillus thiaminolyticus TaxID=49283 RepID=UPI00232E770A|nr:hypothetical protein [Paenibacillus thiaminolyticus]WCF08162.1 hypothetical protein NDS46_28560 [Paenibacillus thiaminolyticus]
MHKNAGQDGTTEIIEAGKTLGKAAGKMAEKMPGKTTGKRRKKVDAAKSDGYGEIRSIMQ